MKRLQDSCGDESVSEISKSPKVAARVLSHARDSWLTECTRFSRVTRRANWHGSSVVCLRSTSPSVVIDNAALRINHSEDFLVNETRTVCSILYDRWRNFQVGHINLDNGYYCEGFPNHTMTGLLAVR